MREKGVFITFEGGDGAGKSTHLQFVAEGLRSRGERVVCLREPGGTAISEQLRRIVLDPDNDVMSPESELLVYESARAQLVAEVIKPELDAGSIVLCDRFADSTVAYQAFGRGLDRTFIDSVNRFACQSIWPDRTILMLTGGDTELGLERATRDKDADRLEMAGVDFHARVNGGFLSLAEEDPERIRVVISDEAMVATARKVFAELSDLFPWMGDPSVCTDAFFADLAMKRDSMERR